MIRMTMNLTMTKNRSKEEKIEENKRNKTKEENAEVAFSFLL